MPAHDTEARIVAGLAPRTPEVLDRVKTHIARLAAEVSDVDVLDQLADAVEAPEGTAGPDLAQRAGVTYRQVDYWTRLGLLTPEDRPAEGSGHVRTYGADQIVKARIMGALVKLFGMAPRAASEVAEEILAHGSAKVGGFTITKRTVA
jgi:hypothetical protein